MRYLHSCSGLVCTLQACVAQAGVLDVVLESKGAGAFDLHALVSPDTTVKNADLGDRTLDLPPNGVNTGLYSFDGAILAAELKIGSGPVSFARALSIQPSGTGSLVDAAWFSTVGSGPDADSRVWLGHFVVESGATLGSPLRGILESRIFVGWTDSAGTGFGVFTIVPTPGTTAGFVLAAMCLGRRRRH